MHKTATDKQPSHRKQEAEQNWYESKGKEFAEEHMKSRMKASAEVRAKRKEEG